MLDPKIIRNDPNAVAAQLARRGYYFDINLFTDLETERKKYQLRTQELQSERNHLSKAIGIAKAKNEDTQQFMEKVGHLGDKLSECEYELNEIQKKLHNFQLNLPNILDNSVPEGKDELSNIEVRKSGIPKKFDFEVKDHLYLGEHLRVDNHSYGLDFERAASLAGSRFCVLHGKLAKLHRALGQFMLDTHITKHGYQETYVPCLVHGNNLVGTGQLPKFKEEFFYAIKGVELYKLIEQLPKLKEQLSQSSIDDFLLGNFCLIPTGEVPLTNLAREKIFNADDLPVRLVAQTPCFRSEAGSYGKDTRGMMRQHQFEKVELVQLIKPEQSNNALEEITQHAASILEALELPYRVMLLCGGDTGFSAAKTYDLEVWMPGQGCYREISSCSNCTDFQARRIQARWRESQGAKPQLLHTLNGSGLAIGRTLIAVMENYQTEKGTIRVPEVLKKYMDCEEITAE